MKKRKFLILLAAILCLTTTMAACGDNSDPDSSGGGVTPPTSLVVPQAPVEHEIRSYFNLSNGIQTTAFTEAVQYEGDLVSYDTDYHLIALRTKDLDNHNNVVETVTVYNYLTNEKLFEHEVKNLLYGDYEDSVNLTVDISYPVIRVSEQRYGEDSEEIYDVSYYFAKKDSALIHNTDSNTFDRIDFWNGLVAFEMGDRVFWVDRDMEVVRSVEAIAANGYELSTDSFHSEFQGYLYSLDWDEIRVFNQAGICSAFYEIKHDGFLNAFVINNGFVLIQDIEEVDGTEPYDFEHCGIYCNMTSYLMNPTDGSLTELELDFYVEALQTRYAEKYAGPDGMTYGESIFPFELAINRDNQAYIYKISNAKLALDEQYVVLNNEMKVEYTVQNSTVGISFEDAYVLNANYYVAEVQERGGTSRYVFDLDGKVLTPIIQPIQFQLTDKYIVTADCIYDHKMNLIYDLNSDEFGYRLIYVDTSIDKIYLNKINYETGYVEFYYFDNLTQKPVLMTDGAEISLSEKTIYSDGIYVTETEFDTAAGIKKFTYYNMEGTPLLVLYGGEDGLHGNEDALIVTSTFEGDGVVYVLR